MPYDFVLARLDVKVLILYLVFDNKSAFLIEESIKLTHSHICERYVLLWILGEQASHISKTYHEYYYYIMAIIIVECKGGGSYYKSGKKEERPLVRVRE